MAFDAKAFAINWNPSIDAASQQQLGIPTVNVPSFQPTAAKMVNSSPTLTKIYSTAGNAQVNTSIPTLPTNAKSASNGVYTYSGGASGISAPAASTVTPEYAYATIGNMYGVDKATAYQEALANTAITRQMEDFRRAGLNPVLAAKYNGASGVGSVGFESTPMYSSGAAYNAGSSKSNALGNIGGMLLKNNNARGMVSALASAGVMAATGNFALGAAAYYGTGTIIDVARSIFK